MKPGYKQTEVGVIPEDWEVKTLQNISPKQSVGLVINPSTYFDKAGTVPLLVGSNVSENYIDPTSANRITKASNECLTASRLSAGDLVTVRVGEPGVTAVVPLELDGCNCASMMIVRKHASFDSLWLCSTMNSHLGRRQVDGVQYGTAQKQFNISDAIDFIFAVPPLPEQRAIAQALSDVDALLAALDQLIAKKRNLKQATMQQLLTGKTRLPGFSGAWEVKLVKDFGEIVTGGTPSTENKEFWGEGYPWITPTDISTERDMVTSERTITQEGLRAIRLLPANTILVTCIASIGKNAILRSVGGCNQQINAIIPNDDNCVEFLYFLMEANKQYLLSNAGTTATAILSKTTFSEMEFLVPVKAEQTAIAAILTDIDTELTALEARRNKTRHLKHAMMQELLTGKTRLI